MTRLRNLLLALFSLAVIASANPLCTATTYDVYVNTYTTLANACQIGDKLFYGFTFTPQSSNATGPNANQVNITPDASNPNEPGIIFGSSLWSVNGSATFANQLYIDNSFSFNVVVIGGLPLITDASLDFSNEFSIAGQGQAFIGETLTLNGGGSGSLGVDSNSGPFTSITHFAGVSSLHVVKDLQVRVIRPTPTGGTNVGSASIAQFREGFSEIPEPLTTVLLGSGLAGLGFLRRRR